MKTTLAILLLVSAIANVVLLSGCASVAGTIVSAPPAFTGEKLETIRRSVPDEDRAQFDLLNSYAEAQRGKTIVVIAPGELEDREKVVLFIQK